MRLQPQSFIFSIHKEIMLLKGLKGQFIVIVVVQVLVNITSLLTY